MGLIRAAAGAVGGTLADSWLEYITAGDMGANTVMTKGVQIKRGKHGSNTKGTPDIISNGSRVEVGPNQMMILVDSGRIMDYTAEEGCYEVFLSSSPSMFNGQLKDSVRESFERFKFGGQPGKSQQSISSTCRRSATSSSAHATPCNTLTISTMQNCSSAVTAAIR